MVMKTLHQHLIEELRDELRPLARTCPVAEVFPSAASNPEDCPLCAVRKLNQSQRFQWFDALTETDLDYLASYHQVCLTAKLHQTQIG
jgi:hypothetical protein